jgi:transposase, IS30 family
LTNIGASNGLLRDYFPKGTDLSTHLPEHLLAVENELNHRPRRILKDHAPAELFAPLLASEIRLCCDLD